jgi:hypothetical protein
VIEVAEPLHHHYPYKASGVPRKGSMPEAFLFEVAMTIKEVSKANIGDYVLATKYDDGDPCDHFCVGFVSEIMRNGRYMIVDNDGNNQRFNGFRRAEKITDDEGRRLVEMMPEIGDTPGPSLWRHLDLIREEANNKRGS